MKIAFLLPTLNFGKDGIADYTARLQGACKELGHETLLIECGRNNWLRNPLLTLQAKKRVEQQVTSFAPDVVSWQFDGRIFHPLSVFPSWVIPRFTLKHSKTHFLAHETWEGDEVKVRLRRKVKGIVQRYSFLRVIKLINPDITHTTNPIYMRHLQSCGLNCTVLPLFSSFPVIQSVTPISLDDSEDLVFVFFGGFHDHWNPRTFVESLKRSKKQVVIHHVGMHRSPASLAALREGCRGWAKFTEHGLLSEFQVSQILLNSDYAVSTYSLPLIKKSSVYATFVDHGLPVIVPRYELGYDLDGVPDYIIPYQNRIEDLDSITRYPIRDSLETVTSQFLKDISTSR